MHKKLPDATRLHELLEYKPDTGKFIWKQRSPEHFTATDKRSLKWLCLWWNKRFAGTEAGTIGTGGYTLIRVDTTDYLAHRLAWVIVYGQEPEFIDHINGDRSDNRLENLRSVTRIENTRNAKKREDNQSGTVGVSYFAPKNTWRARININGKTVLLGYFKTKNEAIAARKAAEITHGYHANHGR